jgi:hypothetical protein
MDFFIGFFVKNKKNIFIKKWKSKKCKKWILKKWKKWCIINNLKIEKIPHLKCSFIFLFFTNNIYNTSLYILYKNIYYQFIV